MVDAYLAVSVFVGFTLMVFIGLDSLTKFDIQSFLTYYMIFSEEVIKVLFNLSNLCRISSVNS